VLISVLIVVIVSLIALIFVFLLAAIYRRISHAKKYKELDKQRQLYREKLKTALYLGNIFSMIDDFRSSPNSIKFQAIEDILLDLISEEIYRENIRKLFVILGYVAFYEKKLKSKNIITKAIAIDKLGKMQSILSTDKLINMLEHKNPEIISVTIRSLANIGTTVCLKGILEFLPKIFEERLITRKAIETSFLKFGRSAVPILVQYGENQSNPKILAIILDTLSHFRDSASLPLAIYNLNHENPEVRAKALKVIETTADKLEEYHIAKIISLFDDPVWFVRLHAAKAIGNLRYDKAVDMLGRLLLDENWQVRNAAATALTKFDDISLDIFLKALRYKDLYAKESICEEIEKTNYIYALIEKLNSHDRNIYSKTREILMIMHSLNFSTPLIEYLETGENNKIKNEIKLILFREVKA
jgi:HEAT repeat protein